MVHYIGNVYFYSGSGCSQIHNKATILGKNITHNPDLAKKPHLTPKDTWGLEEGWC